MAFHLARGWRRPPRLRTGPGEGEDERHATWLELFYDLVFVVAVANLSHTLLGHVSLPGILGFAALFVPVWWAWVGATFYATRFDTDDLVHRLLTLLQMTAVAALAVNVHHALGSSSAGFALSYVAVRAILIVQYRRAGRYLPQARPLTDRYSAGFTLAALLWLVSVFVPPPWRFALWAAGIIIDYGTPLVSGPIVRKIPPHLTHVPERLGLFTLIVLGESVAAVARSLSEQQWTAPATTSALLGLGIAFSLWWIYFDNVNGSVQGVDNGFAQNNDTGGGGQMTRLRARNYQFWLYTHLPFTIGLAATAIGVELAIMAAAPGAPLPPIARWLLCGAFALCQASQGIIHGAAICFGHPVMRSRIRHRFMAAGAALIVGLVAGPWAPPLILVGLLALIGVAQVLLELAAAPNEQPDPAEHAAPATASDVSGEPIALRPDAG